jgi:C-terminal processing protease CtpA/Prc
MMRWLCLTICALLVSVSQAQEIGVQIIEGRVNYTVGFLADFGAPNVTVMLVDRSHFIDQTQRPQRLPDPDYTLPLSGQHLGQVLTDPLLSPFRYQIHLPIVPAAQQRDVDNDGEADAGIALMHVDVVVDMFGDTYWDDQREYSAGFTSTRRGTDFDNRYEITGGQVLIWSPDEAQGFPSGFGADGLLFTDDDPIVMVEPGYSVVDLETSPFTFKRDPLIDVNLIEREQTLQPADYSLLSYAEAFDALIAQMRREYAFTDQKNVDFDALYTTYAPLFQEATDNKDAAAYQWALQNFIWEIPDGHVNAILPRTDNRYLEATDGGLGMTWALLDDGRVIVQHVLPDSPAAGIVPRTEIIALKGQPINAVLDAVRVWSAPFSTAHSLRLQQVRYATRFAVGEDVTLTVQAPGSATQQTVTLTAIPERASWDLSSIERGAASADALPVEFRLLPSGYGYVRINSFAQDPVLMLRLWEWMIDTLNAEDAPGLIIDMRWNSGGYNLYHQMAAYFFDEPLTIGNIARYYEDVGGFIVDPLREEQLPIPVDGRHYAGDIAMIVGPACASACEYFAYNMTLDDRAAIIGHHPTAGLGGSVTPVFMPDNVYMQFTITRALAADGTIRLEGQGVVPTVRVPVNEVTVFAEDDVLLNAAIAHLDEKQQSAQISGGMLRLGVPAVGRLSLGERVRYTVDVPRVGLYDIILSDESRSLDTVLNVYIDPQAPPVLSNDDDPRGGTPNSALLSVELQPMTLVIEVAGFEDSASGDYQLLIQPSEQAAEPPG